MAHALNLNAAAHYVEQPGLVARVRRSLADRREFLATYEMLGAMTDRQLTDIGLTRLSIREIARAAVYAD